MDYEEFTKSPTAELDYTFDWSQWLTSPAVIQTSTWSADSGITIDSYTATNTTATVYLSGGTTNSRYFVSNTIETNTGLIETRTFLIKVELR